MSAHSLRFSRDDDNAFFKTLRKRVNAYFKENNISKYGNEKMIGKTITMVSLYIVPYILIISGTVTQPIAFFSLWILMGMGMAGIGLTIMHDANHGSYSKNPKVNKYMGYFLNLMGGNVLNWKIQHNVLHHSFTNVYGHDEDISRTPILRFSPQQPRKSFHRFQFIYAFLLYGLMTFSWITAKEFLQLKSFKKQGLLEKEGDFNKLFIELIFWKVLYYAYLIVIPIMILPVSPWLIVASFVTMHFLAGLTLSLIFQSAHVMPTSEYPEPDDKGNMENSWAIHQILTTSNFGTSNKALTWVMGGLNHQVEHHLFPSISHVHYSALSDIVKETAEEYGLPYYNQKTFGKAVAQHAKMLHDLGKHDMKPQMA